MEDRDKRDAELKFNDSQRYQMDGSKKGYKGFAYKLWEILQSKKMTNFYRPFSTAGRSSEKHPKAIFSKNLIFCQQTPYFFLRNRGV